MDEIVKRYHGVRTPGGQELRVDVRGQEATIWYLFWGEYQGIDDHYHFGIARVRPDGTGFVIGWMQGTEQEPYESDRVQDLNALIAKLDSQIASR